MIKFDQQFFYDLKILAGQDLSQAHLKQHFTAAKFHVDQAGLSVNGTGTWSAQKPQDSAIYSDGTLTGKKYWISGLSHCKWAVITVKHDQSQAVVMFDPNNVVVEPVPTLGMEDTLTSHVIFNQTPVKFLHNRFDSVCFPMDSYVNLCFLTIQLGLMESLLKDIDIYSGNKFDYEKKKLRTDIEIMKLIWNQEVIVVNESYNDQQSLWNRRELVYAFGKKTLTNVVNFVTEVTGSGLYEPNTPGHQRYKDALIYATHMRNFSASIDSLTDRLTNSQVPDK
jgi:hypothetical protein